jgi:hypothetical protein
MAEILTGTIRIEGLLKGHIIAEGVLSGRLTTSLPDGGYERGYADGYKKGNTEGREVGYNKGHAEGGKAAYDRFWDAFQQMGNRTFYRYAFYGLGSDAWTDATYNPKYPIRASDITGGDSMFQASKITDTKVDIEIGLDASFVFISCGQLKTIRKLIVSEATTFNRWFGGCGALENVTFEGIIANDISFADSFKLSNASVQSIIDHLKDFTGQTGKTLTLHAYVGRELTEAQKAAITAKNWTLVY